MQTWTLLLLFIVSAGFTFTLYECWNPDVAESDVYSRVNYDSEEELEGGGAYIPFLEFESGHSQKSQSGSRKGSSRRSKTVAVTAEDWERMEKAPSRTSSSKRQSSSRHSSQSHPSHKRASTSNSQSSHRPEYSVEVSDSDSDHASAPPSFYSSLKESSSTSKELASYAKEVQPITSDSLPDRDTVRQRNDHRPFDQRFPGRLKRRTCWSENKEACKEICSWVGTSFVYIFWHCKLFQWKHLQTWIVMIFLIGVIVAFELEDDKIKGVFEGLRSGIIAPGNIEWTWIIAVLLMIITSFPPLFGGELILFVIGYCWGILEGCGIAAAGIIIGEVLCFITFKLVIKGKGKGSIRLRNCMHLDIEKVEKHNTKYACLSKLMGRGGWKGFCIVSMVRMTLIPGHLVTAMMSAIDMKIFVYTGAIVISIFEPLGVVWIGEATYQATVSSSGFEHLSLVILIAEVVLSLVTLYLVFFLARPYWAKQKLPYLHMKIAEWSERETTGKLDPKKKKWNEGKIDHAKLELARIFKRLEWLEDIIPGEEQRTKSKSIRKDLAVELQGVKVILDEEEIKRPSQNSPIDPDTLNESKSRRSSGARSSQKGGSLTKRSSQHSHHAASTKRSSKASSTHSVKGPPAYSKVQRPKTVCSLAAPTRSRQQSKKSKSASASLNIILRGRRVRKKQAAEGSLQEG